MSNGDITSFPAADPGSNAHRPMPSPANTQTPENTSCTRIFDDGGAHTVQLIDGVSYCPSCRQPVKEHPHGE